MRPTRARSAVVVALSALLVTVTGVGTASADVYATSRAGGVTVAPSDVRPLTFENQLLGYGLADREVFEIDQRSLGFNEQAGISTLVRGQRTGKVCGVLTLEVTRYQTYTLRWSVGSEGNRTFLRRSGLVRDANRPYVGVFLRSDGNLVIQTYNRLPPVGSGPGRLTTTPFVAASTGTAGRGVAALHVEPDGYTLRTGTGAAVTGGAGLSACRPADL